MFKRKIEKHYPNEAGLPDDFDYTKMAYLDRNNNLIDGNAADDPVMELDDDRQAFSV